MRLEDPVIRYLLHELSPEEREKLEERLFAEDGFEDEIRNREHELLDAYVRGRMSMDMRRRIETGLLFSEAQRDKLQVATALAGKRRAAAAGWYLALAATIAILAGAAWWVIATRHAAAPAARIAAFVLAPGVERGEGIRTVRIPANTDLVRLELELPAGDRRTAFSAVLSNAAGKTLWKKAGIERGRYGLTLSIPAADFQPGDFRLEIAGNPPDLYYFTVQQNRDR